MDKVLILVDYQNEWILEGSDYFVGNIPDVVERVNLLIDFCRREGYKIVFTRHIEEGSVDSFADGLKRSELIDDLHRDESDLVITKYRVSPFFKTELDTELDGISEMVVCGILTNLCVRSLVSDAYDREFGIKVIKDCCVAFDDEVSEFTFRDLKATREEIEFLDLNEFVE